jgi:hypothetical protein
MRATGRRRSTRSALVVLVVATEASEKILRERSSARTAPGRARLRPVGLTLALQPATIYAPE